MAGRGASAVRSAAVAAAVEHDCREFFAISIRAMDASDIDLPPSALRSLLVLDDLRTCTLGELAEHLALSQSATSRAVDKLVARRLVTRRTASGDRRQVSLAATAAGRRATARLVARRREAIAETLAAMAPEARERLRSGLREFAVAARQGTG